MRGYRGGTEGVRYPSKVDPKTRNRIMTGALALVLVIVAVVAAVR